MPKLDGRIWGLGAGALLCVAACHPAARPGPCAPNEACAEAQGAGPAPRGLADYHLHQMSEAAFGGGWVWGEADGDPAQALAPCDGRGLDHGFLAGSEGGVGNVKHHPTGGYPSFDGWPRWNTLSHQQVHADWLRQAHAQGLDLMVMSAVEQTEFCKLRPESTREFPCDDFSSVKRQLAMAHEFERRHADWYQIVLNPAQAREAIAAGKLAVVLSVEAGDLFDGATDPVARLDELHALGVRALQPVHETDNRFGGAAWHHPPLLVLQARHYRTHPEEREQQRQLKRQHHQEVGCEGSASCAARLAERSGFVLDAKGDNLRGLTEEGRALLRAMIQREMIIDVAHLSERGITDAFEVSASHAYYPLFGSHAHFADIEPYEHGEWAYSLAPFHPIAESGGVVGLRSSSTLTRSYPGAGMDNDCDGSSKSFAHRLAWATQELHLEVGLATDFGGLGANLSPRFGPEACAEAPGRARDRQRAAQQGPPGLRLDDWGFAHIGLIGELITELRLLGADTAPLLQGAEVFIRMWERIQDPQRSRLPRRFEDAEAIRALR